MAPAEEHATDLVLTAEEYDGMHAALAAVADSRRNGSPPTLNHLLARWKSVAEELDKEGYADCAPEFHHDIWCRNTLAQVWALLPPRIRTLRQPELDRIDEQYRQATVPWPGRVEGEGAWWHRRIPRLLEAKRSEYREGDWPLGWESMPFPKPHAVAIDIWS